MESQTTIAVHVPLTIRRRGGRKVLIAPATDHANSAACPRLPRIDDALVKALARAHRWRRMLESGQFATVTELAHRERIARSYLCRVLRLTLLSPAIVEAILDGQNGEEFDLPRLLKPFPVEWSVNCRL